MTPRLLLATVAATVSLSAYAAVPSITVHVDGLKNNAPVPEANARCIPTADGKSTNGLNNQPTISWTGAPKETASYALFVLDPDVPADFSDAGKEGKTIAKNAPRKDFFHYGVVDIPAVANQYTSNSGTQYGTPLPNDMGMNKYVPGKTDFGGPCPPWNDARLHHYHFIVMALSKDAPTIAPGTSAKVAYNQLIGNAALLAQGTLTGTYTLNPALKK